MPNTKPQTLKERLTLPTGGGPRDIDSIVADYERYKQSDPKRADVYQMHIDRLRRVQRGAGEKPEY